MPSSYFLTIMTWPISFSMKYGSMENQNPVQNPHQTVTFSGYIDRYWMFSVYQFCLFTRLFIQKLTTLLKMIFQSKISSVVNWLRAHSANTFRFQWLSTVVYIMALSSKFESLKFGVERIDSFSRLLICT